MTIDKITSKTKKVAIVALTAILLSSCEPGNNWGHKRDNNYNPRQERTMHEGYNIEPVTLYSKKF